ncbi:hypothetical protein PILCRDRAFT_338222 [Piloderma croceum F 1598]|uniref:Uncharacterized protein n=1 Tax=Piloderma croceum (strain F 1598) TaxID=765440 RepID=A0A0C3FN06_PILCF|nr:hypothetical protein PILCRDRAFT_338222 [Piloderma croceum F 1598]
MESSQTLRWMAVGLMTNEDLDLLVRDGQHRDHSILHACSTSWHLGSGHGWNCFANFKYAEGYSIIFTYNRVKLNCRP